MKKDFYKILGLHREADLKAIKRAYRAAAKRFHPDLSPQDDERFKELQEAYETLSDPVKRKGYDRETATHPTRPFHEYDSLAGEPAYGSFDQVEDLFSSLDSLWRNTGTDPFRFNIERPDRLGLEIILTPQEARVGGELPLDMPVVMACGRCRGSGEIGGLICGRCRGEGQERVSKRTSITIPPGVRDRMQKMVHFHFLDVGRIDLLVTIRVRKSIC